MKRILWQSLAVVAMSLCLVMVSSQRGRADPGTCVCTSLVCSKDIIEGECETGEGVCWEDYFQCSPEEPNCIICRDA